MFFPVLAQMNNADDGRRAADLDESFAPQICDHEALARLCAHEEGKRKPGDTAGDKKAKIALPTFTERQQTQDM